MSERDTPETDEHYRAHFAEHDHNRRLCKRLERQRDEFKIWWERDSKVLSVALGQRDTARAVAEDNRARYATAERQRDELAEALHRISLASKNSMSSKEECGRIARAILARIDAEKSCQRILSDGKPCGLTPPCPDCGRAVHDFPEAS